MPVPGGFGFYRRLSAPFWELCDAARVKIWRAALPLLLLPITNATEITRFLQACVWARAAGKFRASQGTEALQSPLACAHPRWCPSTRAGGAAEGAEQGQVPPTTVTSSWGSNGLRGAPVARGRFGAGPTVVLGTTSSSGPAPSPAEAGSSSACVSWGSAQRLRSPSCCFWCLISASALPRCRLSWKQQVALGTATSIRRVPHPAPC